MNGGPAIELELLRNYLRVAEMGSITRAARELNLTQPGLSRQMRRLERDAGAQLFSRAGKRLRLTPDGERVLAYAEDVIERHELLLAELRGGDEHLSGALRIVASTTPAEFLVPRLVAEFTGHHAGVYPIVFTTDSEVAAAELMERRWDLAFTGARVDRAGLRYDPVTEDEIVLAVPAGHPLAGSPEVPLEALAGERFIEREGGSGTIMSVRRALGKRGVALPPHRIGMVVSTTRGVVSAVGQGYGVGFVSALALEGEGDRVVGLRLAGVPVRRSLYLVREEHRALPLVAQRFAEAVLARGRISGGGASVPPA